MSRSRSTSQKSTDALLVGFTGRQATVGVIGLGYVGLPLVRAFGEKGFPVVGFDIDTAKVKALNSGQSYIRQIPSSAIKALRAGGKFRATEDFAELKQADAILICVPTPLTKQREPDVSYIVDTTEIIAKHLRPMHLVVLESTTYPGTTTEIMRPILERGGLKSGKDFYLAYSPEREDPGNPRYGTATIPKVVGGDGATAVKLARALYDQAVAGTVGVSSCETAEAVKLTENIFRSVNIALVNELKLIYERMGIDVWEVIEAAKSKPFGYMPFYPGPGLGGHCIPIDPFYLTWKAREYEVTTRFIELAGEINTSMPRYVIDRLAEALDRRHKKALNGSKILLMGLAYKKNVEDIRESPAFKLIELMEARGAEVSFYDPFVPAVPPTREHASLTGRRSVAWNPKAFRKYDAALICTDHDGVDYAELVANSRLVVDTRNATHGVADTARVVVKA
jgi:UDP-N-acetyl-D-glucosamine dehydrogenase